MSIEWFDKAPGGGLVKQDLDGGYVQVMGDDVPDVVRVPEAAGGGVRKVVGVFWGACPVTKVGCRHYELEGGLFVAESDQFYWYRRTNRKHCPDCGPTTVCPHGYSDLA